MSGFPPLRRRAAIVALVASGLLTPLCWSAEYFVSASGSATGDGSRARPWDLATALAHPAAVQPGDKLVVGEGRYEGGFTSTLKGKAEAPITVSAEGRVVIDCRPRDARDSGLFSAEGEWAIFNGFEVTCSDLKRETSEKGSWPADIRRGGVSVRGSHLKVVNFIVHDTAQGFGLWGNEERGEGGEIYGCIIYNNGWKGPDRGHGHGIYAQNARGTKRIVDNVIFNQFGHGLHAYGSEKATLRGFHVEGNAIFNNGSLNSLTYRTTDLAIGGGSAMEDITAIGNYTYGGGGLHLGYVATVQNRGVTATDNYIAGHVKFTALAEATFTRNTIIAAGTVASLQAPHPAGAGPYRWNNNTYLRTKREWAAFNLLRADATSAATFPQWQAQTGFDAESQYDEAAPRGVKVAVRPNQYEKGRAHVIVYNWDRAETVTVDLGGVLAVQQKFGIYSVQNLTGEPVLRGAYSGPVQIPMKPTKPAAPVGLPDAVLPVTEPEFGVFVVIPERS
jgi:hypothetical protein